MFIEKILEFISVLFKLFPKNNEPVLFDVLIYVLSLSPEFITTLPSKYKVPLKFVVPIILLVDLRLPKEKS